MTKFNIIPSIDRMPSFIKFAQEPLGKLCLWVSGCALIFILQFSGNKYFHFTKGFLWDKFTIIALFFLFPHKKKILFILASLYWLIFHGYAATYETTFMHLIYWSENSLVPLYSLVLALTLFFGINFLLTRVLKNNFTWQLCAIFFLFNTLLFIAGIFPIQTTTHASFAGALFYLSTIMWYWLYALKNERRPITLLPTFFPFWNWSSLPIPKGWNTLEELEAKNEHDLALSRLKGLKLLLWALVLGMIQYIITHIGTSFSIPRLEDAVRVFTTPQRLSLAVNWLSVFYDFVSLLISLAVGSHLLIGTVRLLGWNVKRNVYAPFQATSISDFFNRYYYYFKELLLELFFYPSYFSCFKRFPTLRLFFATLMSAGLGNFLFHFYLSISRVFHQGIWRALNSSSVYATYCLILACGIFISQWARLNHAFKTPRWFTTIRILAFFMLLNIFLETSGTTTNLQHFQFLFGLFGLNDLNH